MEDLLKQVVQIVAKNSEAIQNLIESNKKEVSVSTNPVPFPRPLDVENGEIQQQFNLFKNNWIEYGIASGLNKGSDEKKLNTFMMMIGDAEMQS